MAIQKSDAEYPQVSPSPLTGGGNRTIINGDEDNAPASMYESTPIRRSLLGEDDSYVQGVFRGLEL